MRKNLLFQKRTKAKRKICEKLTAKRAAKRAKLKGELTEKNLLIPRDHVGQGRRGQVSRREVRSPHS